MGPSVSVRDVVLVLGSLLLLADYFTCKPDGTGKLGFTSYKNVPQLEMNFSNKINIFISLSQVVYVMNVGRGLRNYLYCDDVIVVVMP
jgi:hypothetical protein